MPSFMDDMEVGMGNGKTNRRHSDFDVASMDLSLEYSQAKANLCTPKDKSTPLDNKETNPSEELYRALTDKNRAIEILKRRLTNQQIQLGYYLHKNLATEAVLEFSSKCFPHLAEDSTQLSLAMYKFIRDTGGKTRLAQLREKLTDYNNRVHKALLRQEQLVRQGFGFDDAGDIRRNDEEVVDDGDAEMSDDFRFAKKYYKSAKLEMCSQLMSLTLQVRKELERFRICAENVVKLEEERNALVDRVFSLPVEERYGNLHVSMVEHPKQESSTSLRSTTSASTNTTAVVEGKPPTTSLGGALQDMESEAIQLLLLSEKQKNEFVIALEEARVENQQLRERLRDLEEAASDERVIQLQEKCNSIEREVDAMRKDLEAEQNEKEQIIKRMALEIDERDLSDKDLKAELKTLKSTVELLRNEKDSLQKKLEDTTKHYIEQLNKITSTDDMLTTNSEPVSQQDVNDLTELVVLQEEQIKDLLSIMSDMNPNEDTSESSTSTKEAEDQSVEEAPPEKEEADDQEYHIYYDSTSDFSNQDASEDGRIAPEDSPANCDSKDTSREAKTEVPQVKIRRSRSPLLRERHRQGLATTSLRVQAFDKDGKSESMHAVLECSSPVDGLLEMNNSSKLHLRLQCTSPQRTNYIETPNSTNTSCTFCPQKHVSGDHVHSVVVDSNSAGCHLSRETKIYLTTQLNKIKSRLQTSKSSLTTRKEIVQNLNEIYSQLFGQDDEIMTQSTRN